MAWVFVPLSALFVIVITLAIRRVIIRGNWTAEVTDVRESHPTDPESSEKPQLHISFRRNDGKRGRMEIPLDEVKDFFPDGIRRGDFLIKRKHDKMPKRAPENE